MRMIPPARRAILSALHSRCIKRGGGTWPDEAPATSSRRESGGTVPIPLRCDRTPSEASVTERRRLTTLKGAFNACPGTGLQGMWDGVRAGGPLRLRPLLRPARGALRPRLARRGLGEAAHPGGAAEPLALLGLPAVRAAPEVSAAGRWHAPGARAAPG